MTEETPVVNSTETTPAEAETTPVAMQGEQPGTKQTEAPQDPPIRSNAWWAQRRIESKKANATPQVEEQQSPEYNTEDEELMQRTFEKFFTPYKKQMESQMESQIDSEVKAFVSDNPSFKSFEKTISAWAKHENLRHLPVESIAYMAAGKQLLSMGAKQARVSDAEKARSQTGGGTPKAQTGEMNIDPLTPEGRKNLMKLNQDTLARIQ